MRTSTEQEMSTLRAETEREVNRLRTEANEEVAALRAAANREVTTMREEAASERAAADAEARRQTENMVADAESRAEDAERRLVIATQRATALTESSKREAATRIADSQHEAEELLSAAREEAQRIRQAAATKAAARTAEADEHVASLQAQCDALTSYLDDMRAMLAPNESGLVLSNIMEAAGLKPAPVAAQRPAWMDEVAEGGDTGEDEAVVEAVEDAPVEDAEPAPAEAKKEPEAKKTPKDAKPAEAKKLVTGVEDRFAAAKKEHPEFAGATGVVATPYEGTFVFGSQDPRSRLLADLGFTPPKDLDKVIGDEFGANISKERLDLLDQDAALWIAPDTTSSVRKLHADKIYGDLDVAKQGREVFVKETSDYGNAVSLSTVLSIPYVLDRLVPQLAAAVDGKPATKVENPAS